MSNIEDYIEKFSDYISDKLNKNKIDSIEKKFESNDKERCFFVLNELISKFKKVYTYDVVNYEDKESQAINEKYEYDTMPYYQAIYTEVFMFFILEILKYCKENIFDDNIKKIVNLISKNKINNFTEQIILITYLNVLPKNIDFNDLKIYYKKYVISQLEAHFFIYPKTGQILGISRPFIKKDMRYCSKDVIKLLKKDKDSEYKDILS